MTNLFKALSTTLWFALLSSCNQQGGSGSSSVNSENGSLAAFSDGDDIPGGPGNSRPKRHCLYAFSPNQTNSVQAYKVDTQSGELDPSTAFSYSFGPSADGEIFASGTALAVSQQNQEALAIYGINATDCSLSERAKISIPGFSPYKVAIHPNQKFIYVSDADNNKIYGFEFDASRDQLSALPGSPYFGGQRPGDLQIHASGLTLYFNSEGDQFLFSHLIAANGALTRSADRVDLTTTHISDISLSPLGTFLLQVGIGSHSIYSQTSVIIPTAIHADFGIWWVDPTNDTRSDGFSAPVFNTRGDIFYYGNKNPGQIEAYQYNRFAMLSSLGNTPRGTGTFPITVFNNDRNLLVKSGTQLEIFDLAGSGSLLIPAATTLNTSSSWESFALDKESGLLVGVEGTNANQAKLLSYKINSSNLSLQQSQLQVSLSHAGSEVKFLRLSPALE